MNRHCQKIIFALFFALGVAAEGAERPRLIVFIVVDQLRWDYLERFEPIFSGGFRRLLDEGVYFAEARHNHAVTTTGPGHAALTTGLHPGRSGIIDNAWFDRRAGSPVNCVQDDESPILGDPSASGRSPRNLLGPTLADWIKKAFPGSKIVSASRKDRGAIIPGGRGADLALWYDLDTGRFVTSQYYARDYPDWVQLFNQRRIPDSWFGKQWKSLEFKREWLRLLPRLDVEEIDEGLFPRRLPRSLGQATLAPDASFYADFGSCPLMDSYLAELAKTAVGAESLGADDEPDILGLSFSALDSVGHSYGPNSKQVMDALLRLDAALGDLFEFLDRSVGWDRIAVALSSDHGVATLPEFQILRNRQAGRRFGDEERLCVQRAGLELNRQLGRDDWWLYGLYLNYETLGRRNLRRSDVERKTAALLSRCPAVERVWTRTELESGQERNDVELFRNSFNSERSPDLYVQWRAHYVNYGGHGTTHGSAYDYDRRVPVILRLPGLAARRVETSIHTVDVAPTLASALGLPVPDGLDGVDRGALFGAAADAARRR